MFEAIINAVKVFDERYKAASIAWLDTRKQINQDFANKLKETKLAEGKALFDNAVMTARAEAIKIVADEFAIIRGKIEEVVTAVPDSKLMQLVEAVKVAGAGVSSSEAEAYIRKVHSNYPAELAVANAFAENKVKDSHGNTVDIVRYDDILSQLADIENLVGMAIREDIPESYNARLVTVESDDNILKAFEREYLIPFINR